LHNQHSYRRKSKKFDSSPENKILQSKAWEQINNIYLIISSQGFVVKVVCSALGSTSHIIKVFFALFYSFSPPLSVFLKEMKFSSYIQGIK